MSFIGPAPEEGDLRHIGVLFTDIDDTLTTHGRLLPQTFQALWDLFEAGVSVVPVTGGSAGWCEHIVRAWPVAAVIGESGAFSMTARRNRVEVRFWDDEDRQAQRQAAHLEAVRPLLGQFQLAHDQRLRLADVAIDIIGQDVAEVEALAQSIRNIGASVAISSVHINTWLGPYDKRTMSERLLAELGLAEGSTPTDIGFVGDSRNDAPMFALVDKSFGVANIVPVLPLLPARPRWISSSEAGLGFADIAQAIVAARRASR
ncbi:MAG: HAD-IIB family hydrolase [Devosia sp.]|uniref:HAD-IIB family hydrolase n=1 Tax=Devosia sp. TaxID=1871048 RepID=UPI0024CC96F1|nr:HAD-IIB family hydrolase [Devosia sp.]UYN98094.1 MAG: HAD-IIB family hydrolase [Devosia sp.]